MSDISGSGPVPSDAELEAMEAPEPMSAFEMMMLDEREDAPVFPLNRVVAFLGPYISLLAGFISTWLITNVSLFNTLNVSNDDVLKTVTELVVFAVVSGLTWLGQRKWLNGHIRWEAGQQEIEKAAVAGYAASLPPAPAPTPPEDTVYDEEAAKAELAKREATISKLFQDQ